MSARVDETHQGNPKIFDLGQRWLSQAVVGASRSGWPPVASLAFGFTLDVDEWWSWWRSEESEHEHILLAILSAIVQSMCNHQAVRTQPPMFCESVNSLPVPMHPVSWLFEVLSV